MGRINLLPLCYTRPCGNLRVGIVTLDEKWQHLASAKTSFLTEDYLSQKFTATYSSDNYYINGRVIANEDLVTKIQNLKEGQGLTGENENEIIAFRSSKSYTKKIEFLDEIEFLKCDCTYSILNNSYDIFTLNDQEIRNDFKLLTKNRKSKSISKTNTLIGDNIFVEEGAYVEASTLNSNEGPIYIGKDAQILEGNLIRGPLALCNNATIKMGAKIYGATTIGPHCKVGGEISNVVFQSYSNKGHDGFMGNSVVGEWCNLGADTNCSNLKNNYAPVKLWNYETKRFVNTGLQFCGLIMGDHSKCGINTMFNTGTVVGVSANIYGAAFPRNFIPSFTWGGATGFSTYAQGKAFETAKKVMERRSIELNDIDKDILKHIFEASSEHRFWENKPMNV
ncbi:MAG: GlmU family protein [Bacteroidia bacterium]|nr:GlmU family protein [Bacteroidia bacterium]